jgi:hypothetical protein
MEWAYIVLTVFIGIIFYWLRCSRRVLYGAIEIIVALALIYEFYFPLDGIVVHSVGSDYVPPTIWHVLASRSVHLVVSIYVFVRGCDNVVTGLRNGSDI